MGVARDITEDIGCSDQRLIFRLVLAEVRRLRKSVRDAKAILSGTAQDRIPRAIEALDGKEPPMWADEWGKQLAEGK